VAASRPEQREQIMRAQAVTHERHLVPAHWMSRKSMRLAVLLGSLLAVSIAVNAAIIVAAGGS
jgi:hypothetical protein